MKASLGRGCVVNHAPSITSPTSVTGTVGSPFSYQITAGNTPTAYGASGLPDGLSINTATGLISGRPASAGISIVTMTVTVSGGVLSGTPGDADFSGNLDGDTWSNQRW